MGGDTTSSAMGLPLLSRAGVNRARLLKIEQVARSKADEPLDELTEHAVTLPSAPTVSRTLTVPCSSRSAAADG